MDDDIIHRVLTESLANLEAYKSTDNPRLQSTYQIVQCVYYSVEIYQSMIFDRDVPYAEAASAREIIKISEVLMRGRTEPPRSKIWPVPIFLAALEVDDPVYLSWCFDHFEKLKSTGKNYERAISVIKEVRQHQKQEGKRAVTGVIMKKLGGRFLV